MFAKAVVLEEQQFQSPLCFHMWIAVSPAPKVRPRVSPGRRFGHPNPFRIRGDKVVPGHLWVGERLSQSFGATWFSYGFIILECSESCWFLASIFTSERQCRIGFCIMGYVWLKLFARIQGTSADDIKDQHRQLGNTAVLTKRQDLENVYSTFAMLESLKKMATSKITTWNTGRIHPT